MVEQMGDHSFHYCVAVAMIAGEVTPDPFTPKWLTDKKVAQLIERTRIEAKPEFTRLYQQGARPAVVEVTTLRGVFCREVPYPRSDPCNPMSLEEVAAKFISRAEPYLSSRGAQQVVEEISAMDSQASMALFTESLKGAQNS
jgi:2-methylcitrate dehydratase PrpD